ncbi:MAG: VOC family protein [Crocinitomicaceae bacterium]|nr:VOC family protein [Crocinitomicaceae bacterium]
MGCKPKILNPEVLLPKSTFVVADGEISCAPDGTLSWTTTGESGKLTFTIEQYRWNKWVAIGEVDGLGTEGPNKYTFKVSPHSGENKVRVVQTDHTGRKRPSPETTFTNTSIKEPSIFPVKTSFFKTGESKIELLQATDPTSAIAKFIEKKGEGIHHLAFEVADIDFEINRLKAEGFELIHQTPKDGADNKRIAFLHPKSTNGVLLELCQEKK